MFFILCLAEASSQNVILRGRVTDAESGEILSDANLFEQNAKTGMATNAYGLYSMALQRGVCIVKCSMLGYITQIDTLNLVSNKVLDFALKPDNYLLQSVEVLGSQKHSGQLSLTQKDIQALPMIGGEPDLMKSLQYLPGVVSGNEGANNISVRGGNQWGNLVLLDEAIVYNPNHVLSFFSVFNNDAVQKVNLYKSYFPLNYGGRASSVIDVRMKEGNNKERNRTASVGLVASKILFEGPLEKGKSSYLVSARVGYPSVPLALFGEKITSPPSMYFYDVNAKINKTINERNRIYFSLYSGGDHTVFDRLVRGYGMDWGNATATLRWNHVLNEKTYGNWSAIFSNYYYRYKSLSDGLHYLWKSNMQSYQMKYDLEHWFTNRLKVKSGAAAHFFTTMPGEVEKSGEPSNIVPYRMEQRKLLDAALYGEIEYKISPQFQLNAGVRLSVLHAPKTQGYESKAFFLPEPRAELSYYPDRNNRISVSFNQTSQTLHMLSNSSVGLPSDIWVPANALLKPAVMRQVAVGYEHNIMDRLYTFSVEAYYRKTNRIIDYKDNANIFLNNRIEDEIETGSSKAYGIEFYLTKNRGKFTGWLSYTLSRSRNRLANIKDTEYRPVYDRPHNLKLFLNYNIGKRLSLSSTFSFCSGMNVTLPSAKYASQGAVLFIYTERNGYRAPAFHQLDLSGTYRFNKGRSLTLSVINVYSRKNVFSIYAGREGYSSMHRSMLYKMYLYGIVPSLTYSFKF